MQGEDEEVGWPFFLEVGPDPEAVSRTLLKWLNHPGHNHWDETTGDNWKQATFRHLRYASVLFSFHKFRRSYLKEMGCVYVSRLQTVCLGQSEARCMLSVEALSRSPSRLKAAADLRLGIISDGTASYGRQD